VLLVDHAGTVMFASGGPLAALKPGVSIAGSALFGLAQAQAAGGVGEIDGSDGAHQVWAVAGAPVARQAGLYLMLGVARQDLVADTRLRLRQALLTLAAIAVLLFAGVFQLAEWGIRRQIDRITSMARRLGSGDLSARIEPPYPRGEMGGLMAVLNSTAASLQRQRDEIDALGLRLRQAQKLEALGTLAGGIAHDFNNILGAILGNLSLASEEALTGQPTQHSLQQIRRAALRARDLVQRIQAFSRPDLPAMSEQLLRPIVDEVLALAEVALPAGAQLRSELTDEPLRVRADATQLHQVLMNLCTNATQALQGEPGTVTVGLQGVVFGDGTPNRPPGLARGHYAHLWVRDTGCGIADADRDRIFEPFFTTKGARGGTGLGLSAVHGIVGAHGGTISLESRSGAGSTFHIHLPALADPAGAADAPGAAAAPASAAPGHGEHIVYVDDDEVMALMVERLLQRAGYRASCHVSARAALAAVRADPQGCDLVVTDFNMPELSGLDVSRELAALRPGLPVLIMSGYVFDELPAQASRAGVREVIQKQNVLDDLVPAIARALAAAGA
jgi:signal transduction histidine kinase/ActR/RegA family two-component response regulator